MKDVFSVDLSPSAPPVRNVLSVVEGLPVGARLQKLWQVWAQKGSSPRVVSILKEGYNLPFKISSHLDFSDKEQICPTPQILDLFVVLRHIQQPGSYGDR